MTLAIALALTINMIARTSTEALIEAVDVLSTAKTTCHSLSLFNRCTDQLDLIADELGNREIAADAVMYEGSALEEDINIWCGYVPALLDLRTKALAAGVRPALVNMAYDAAIKALCCGWDGAFGGAHNRLRQLANN